LEEARNPVGNDAKVGVVGIAAVVDAVGITDTRAEAEAGGEAVDGIVVVGSGVRASDLIRGTEDGDTSRLHPDHLWYL
jgi:hypothetical protein